MPIPRRAFTCLLMASSQPFACALAPDLRHPWFAVDAAAAGPSRVATEPGGTAAMERLLQWPQAVVGLVVKYQQNPLRAARALSHVQVALHDAWWRAGAAGAGTGLREAAAHRAAARVLEQLYPHETPGQFDARASAAAHALALPATAAADAAATGEAVARALVDRSLRDGAGRAWSPAQRPPDFPGAWQPTFPLYAANPAEGMAPAWRPWIARPEGRHDPPPPPRPGSDRHRDETREVLAVARALQPWQRALAQAWHLDAGSVTPAGIWMQRTLAAAREAAQGVPAPCATALHVTTAVAVAMHDAFIDCWRVKMRHWSERPVTAVRRELDPAFEPLLVTPGFPGYVSGHAAVSAAAAEVLGHLLPRHRALFTGWAQEAAASRLWGGIHFRCDNEEGLRLGQAVGRDVVARLQA